MNSPIPLMEYRQDFFIRGTTLDGQPFRPSDWSDRLCGIMACFKPAWSPAGHLQYSPYVYPRQIGNEKVVVIEAALRELEPLAHDFAINFARDNRLQTGLLSELSLLAK